MKKYYPLIVVLLAGLALRFYNNTLISLWHDEAFSALLIKYPWGEMFYRIGLDVHPPMYYVFLRVWHYIFGDSLLSLRGMSVFFGVATILAGYAFVKEAFKNEKAALWAAVLIALSPFQIQYVTEARMYTMGAFFAVLAAFFLSRALRLQKQYLEDQKLNMPNLPGDLKLRKSYMLHYLGFAISTGIIILTHYYLLFTAAALMVYGLAWLLYHYRFDFRKYGSFLASCLLVFLSFVPWLKIFLFQYRQVGEGYWIPKIDMWSIPSTLWQMLLGIGIDINKNQTRISIVLVTLFTVYFLTLFLKKTQGFEKWLVALALAAPFGGAVLFYLMARMKGSDSSVYLVRYFLFASTFYTIALAVWLREINFRALGMTLLGLYCAVNLLAVYNFWSDLDVKSKPGMAAAGKFLQANMEPGNKLYVGSSFAFFNLKYYLSQAQKECGCIEPLPRLFTAGTTDVKNISHFAGSAILANSDLLPDFAAATGRGDTVWLVWTNGFGSGKPETPNNWVQVDEQGYAEVRPWVGTYVFVTMYKVN